jgi:uncharacterized protein (TIGR02453 family)
VEREAKRLSTMKKTHFSRDLFTFLKELGCNNRREWFEANRARYERYVREPMLAFIADFAPQLKKISPKLIADPRPSGGSMFRIYRDVRFSPDKRPYKTHVSARFSHVMGRDVHAPGFYVHLEPGGVFFAAGIWHPDPATLAKIRDFIVKHPAQWKKAINDANFCKLCTLEGDVLSRPPKGYDPRHPLIDDLKRKDFIAVTNLDEAEAFAPSFTDRFTAVCVAASPLMRFLTRALDLQF